MYCLKKNQNAPRPSEHPPLKGEKMSKRLGGIKDCKYKTSSCIVCCECRFVSSILAGMIFYLHLHLGFGGGKGEERE